MKKKILFLTGTRADYGKLKILITATQLNKKFKPIILATGMHMQKHYGFTCNEIKKDFKNIELHTFSNQLKNSSMDLVLAKTIQCLNKLLKKIKPDLMIVPGDRVETLAASIYELDQVKRHGTKHIGFDWRWLAQTLRQNVKIVRKTTSPLKIIPKFVSPSIGFVCVHDEFLEK